MLLIFGLQETINQNFMGIKWENPDSQNTLDLYLLVLKTGHFETFDFRIWEVLAS